MANIDIDAARAARRAKQEQDGVQHTLTFGGETYSLPAELEFSVAEGLRLGDWRQVMESLLGPEQAEKFFADKPTAADLRVVLNGDEELGIEGIVSLYATDDAGESSPSSKPSSESGNGSKPVSSLSTTST
jgi:hypothetical protein